MTHEDLIVGVAESVSSRKGVETLAEYALDPRNLEMTTLDEAMKRKWDSDAHFALYQILGETAWPRVNKPLIREIREQGQDIVVGALALDYDLPDHKAGVWTPEMQTGFIAAAADAVGEIGNWRYLYFTRRGARLIYVFDVPLDVEDYEDVYRGFVEAWTGTIEFDRKVGQWNRLFRLPHVLRDDVRSETAATFDFIERPGVVVEAMNAPRVKQKGFDRVSAPKLDRTQPIAEDAMEIVWEGGEPFKRLTTLGKTYKPFFYGKDCFGALFEAKPLAGQGARHTTLLAVVGLAVGKLSRVPGTTAEAIYGLLYPAV